MGYGPHRFFWKALWKLDTLPKIRVFTWRVGHKILPTYEKIASIRHGFEKRCLRIRYGMIIRADEGFVLGAGGGFIESRLSVEETEYVAF
ncbi:hypothetical protein PVK06_011565 [Gossypium arboreum]|uniref:Reverse transcriptase zinc-binding domain-containing protein n=1 Tax=Gossypium arboreum TaxID=29729 RepID=A0ABR0QA44_GOSAR|nr:hypothetical protein PVK06_011565 [Gossypium arboreum]